VIGAYATIAGRRYRRLDRLRDDDPRWCRAVRASPGSSDANASPSRLSQLIAAGSMTSRRRAGRWQRCGRQSPSSAGASATASAACGYARADKARLRLRDDPGRPDGGSSPPRRGGSSRQSSRRASAARRHALSRQARWDRRVADPKLARGQPQVLCIVEARRQPESVRDVAHQARLGSGQPKSELRLVGAIADVHRGCARLWRYIFSVVSSPE
jgi:hypothetical protein